METVICTATTSNYIQYWEAFFKSLSSKKNNIFILIECINFNDENKKYLELLVKKYSFENNIKKIFTTPKIKNLKEIAGYATNRRAFLLRDSLFYNPKKVVYADINTIFLDGFFNLLYDEKSLSTFIYDNHDARLKAVKNDYQKAFQFAKLKKFRKYIGPLGSILKSVCLAGFQFYKIDHNVEKMINDYAELVSRKHLQWWTDQEALAILILKYRKKINFNLVGHNYVGLTNFITSDLFCICSKGGRTNLYDDYSYFFLNKNKSFNDFFSNKPLFKLSLLKKLFNRFMFKNLSSIKTFNLKNIYFNKILNILFFSNKRYIYKKVINKIKLFKKDSKILVSCKYINSQGIFNGIRGIYYQDFVFFDIYYYCFSSNIYFSYKSQFKDYLLFSPEEFFDGFGKK